MVVKKKEHTNVDNIPCPLRFHISTKEMARCAQSLNHCEGGMCFESALPFHPGETVNIRVKEFHPHGPCKGLCEGLRSITLAEVKWCSETSITNVSHYRVGIQFYAPVY